MLKKFAGIAALSLLTVVELQAGIFGSRGGGGGGCPNGQCGMRTYQPTNSVAQTAVMPATVVAQTEEAPVTTTVSTQAAQPTYSVASQPVRGRFGRRWSR